MHLGSVTYNVLKDMDLETIIKTLEAAGFEGVELRTEHKHGIEPSIGPAERDRVRKRFAASKVRLVSYGTTAEFHSPEEAVRMKNVVTAKHFIDLAHDTGALGIKVRPNGLPKDVPHETTIARIGECLREVGTYGKQKGIEIWMEVHGRDTQNPPVSAAIMRAAKHDNVGVCWNSNETDVVNGSVKPSFQLLRPWIKSAHINELHNSYPWRELFTLFREMKYDRYTLCECQENPQPERFLRYYAALWRELNRA
jgi:sugar phosphate isomerase/epimerase